ncbi:MAG: M28 family peptidase [Bacteroidales bacterium]
MKNFRIVLMFLLFFCGTSYLRGQDPGFHTNTRIKLREHVSFLASDSLGGRLIGTEGNLIAGEYIADCFADIGLEEYDGSSYFHYFNVSLTGAVKGIPLAVIEGCNVIGVLPGTHPRLQEEYIVVGAHYDHLGTLPGAAPSVDSIYNGADDNASGTAVLIELARRMKEKGGLSRTIIFVAFDGEEQGLLGSGFFLKDSLFPQHKIRTMISLDMLGYYSTSGVLKMLGTGTLAKSRDWVPETLTLKVRCIPFEWSPFTATDTKPFAALQIPTLFLTTGSTSPYHKVNDQEEGIDYDGMAGITGYADRLLTVLGDHPSLVPSGELAVVHYVPEYDFRWGPAVALGTNRFIHTRGALEGRTAFYAAVGAEARFLWRRYLEVNPGLYLEQMGARHAETAGDPFLNRIQMLALGVPLTFRVYFPAQHTLPVGIYASLTTFYRLYLCGSTNDPDRLFSDIYRRNEWGLGLGFGLRASAFQVGYEFRWGLSGRFRPEAVRGYNVRNSTGYITFSYFF